VLLRSALARRHGIALVSAPGSIDEGHRGELEVLLLNADREKARELRAGDRVAPLVAIPALRPSRSSWSCVRFGPGQRRIRLQRRMGFVAPGRSW
jgi:dUTPase